MMAVWAKAADTDSLVEGSSPDMGIVVGVCVTNKPLPIGHKQTNKN